MGIYIPNMEMPASCVGCILTYDDGQDVCCVFTGVPCLGIGRQDACPLVPLPEGHGGLCDRDALIKELQNLFDKREKDAAFSGNRGPSVTWNDAICSIFAAPVIVPAEGGEADGN